MAIAPDVLRDDVVRLVVGELILTAGLGALVLHLIRSRTTDRSTVYFGLAAVLYGFRLIVQIQSLQSTFPQVPWRGFEAAITLVIGLPFAFYLGSTLARTYSWFTRAVIIVLGLFALFGGVRLIQGGWVNPVLMTPVWVLNGIITVTSLLGWGYIGVFPRIPIDREVRALRIGLLVLGLFVLFQNLSVIGVLPPAGYFEWVGMLFLLGTFFYVSASRSLRQEANLIALSNELEIARQIQSALLPRLGEAIAGMQIQARYSPAGSVAGDFYDVLSDGSGLGVLIADVSGHGVPAALSASMLKVALRAQTDRMARPAQVLSELNRALGDMLGNQFITAAYVYFDPQRRELHYSGAGHPPILLWHAAARRVEALEENGLFLGPFPGAEYRAICARFEPGDRCLLYTDGVVEASNRQDEEFGAMRLIDFLAASSALPADSLCSVLLDRVTGWAGQEPDSQQDDISFILVEFQPSVVGHEADAERGASALNPEHAISHLVH